MGASPDDVAVRKEAFVGVRIHLLCRAHIEVAIAPEQAGEMLGQIVVLRTRRTPEMIEGQFEFFAGLLLQPVLLVAEAAHVLAGFEGGKFGRGAMLVGGAQDERLDAPRLLEASECLGRQQ
jgi:hypothetical protein